MPPSADEGPSAAELSPTAFSDVRPRDSATVLLVRQGAEAPEIYMVKRHRGNKFMANAFVFVGGCVDAGDDDPGIAARSRYAGDAALAQVLGLDAATDAGRARALYVAALREAFEESGLLLADAHGGLSQHRLDALRDRLNGGACSFTAVLEQLDATLALDALRYLAYWVTPPFEPRRFDTRFFIARAPAGQRARFDERETTAGAWFTPREVLAAHEREEVKLAPPTLCVLEDLLHATSVEEALARAPDRPLAPISPRLLEGAARLTLLMPDDHRFADPRSSAGREDFLVLEGRHWIHVRR